MMDVFTLDNCSQSCEADCTLDLLSDVRELREYI